MQETRALGRRDRHAPPAVRYRRRPLRRFLYWIGFLFLRLAASFLGALSYPAAYRIGQSLGPILYHLLPAARRKALENLEIAFGSELDEAGRVHICKRMFAHLGSLALETLIVPVTGRGIVRDYVDCVGGADVKLRRILAEGGGFVVQSAHLGSWELYGRWVSLVVPTVVVAKASTYQPLTDWFYNRRRRAGMEVVDIYESARVLLGAMRDGKAVVLLSDQDVKGLHGVFVEMFSRPTFTPSAPAAFGRAGRVVVPVYGVRAGMRHEMFVFDPVEFVRTGDKEADLVENTQRWVRILESMIRRNPEIYLWTKSRWRVQPGDEERIKRWRSRRGGGLR